MVFQLIIIQIVTFAGLIFVLRLLFYRQLNFALRRLNILHEQNLAREEELKKELDNVRAQRDAELAKSREESEHILKAAKEKSEKIEEQFLAQAKEEAARVIEHAKAESVKFKNELESSYQENALNLSAEIVSRAFSDKDSEVLQRQLIDELTGEIKNIPLSQFTVKSKSVKVKCAYPLQEKEKQELVKILSEKTNTPVELAIEDDSDVIAGLIIEIGVLTLDGSLKNKMRKILSQIKKENSGKA